MFRYDTSIFLPIQFAGMFFSLIFFGINGCVRLMSSCILIHQVLSDALSFHKAHETTWLIFNVKYNLLVEVSPFFFFGFIDVHTLLGSSYI